MYNNAMTTIIDTSTPQKATDLNIFPKNALNLLVFFLVFTKYAEVSF